MEENIVRTALGALNLSAPEFARLIGVTPRAVTLWLASQREVPGPVRAYVRLLLSIPSALRRSELENALTERKVAMRPYKHKFMLWLLIAACDTGEYDKLGVDEVHQHATAGTIAPFMLNTFGRDRNFSVFEPSDWTTIGKMWGSIANATDYDRKFGVERRGICLLMAYALQCVQMVESEAETV
jgi:hypothetical protein